MKKDQEGSFQQEGPLQNQGEQRKVRKRPTVSCAICQAVYTPSRQRSDLLQTTPLALESAFMSMCHFCFRCRRPACPECWDEVHGLCGECVREATLPFRTELPPLAGTLLPPPRRKSVKGKKEPDPLIAIRPGNFAEPQVLPIDMITTRPEKPEAVPQAVSREQKEARAPRRVVSQQVEEKREKQRVAQARSSERGGWKSMGRVVAWCLLGVLLCVLLVIVLALASADVNAFIDIFLYIDVRMEIGSLLRLLGQIFS